MKKNYLRKLKLLYEEIENIKDDFSNLYFKNLSKIDKKKALKLLETLELNLQAGLEDWLVKNHSSKFDRATISPFNKNLINSKLHKAMASECEICGEKRVFHIAHIIPRNLDGGDNIDNLLRLCANCHALFDRKKLTKKQLKKIKWKNKSFESFNYVQQLYGMKL